MIIKSKFHDYYDHCIGYGVDKGIVFERETVVVDMTIRRSRGRNQLHDAAVAIEAWIASIEDRLVAISSRYHDIAWVGFCGKLYPALVHYEHEGKYLTPYDHFRSGLGKAVFRWNLKDFTEQELSATTKSQHSYLVRSGAKSIPEWFEKNAQNLVHENTQLFIDHNLVSFLYLGNQVVFNPLLKDLNFQKRIDGVTAFQDISMHVSGVLTQSGKGHEPIADKTMARSKGFDDMSFRKSPTKKNS